MARAYWELDTAVAWVWEHGLAAAPNYPGDDRSQPIYIRISIRIPWIRSTAKRLSPSISMTSFASAHALGATRERTCRPAEVGDEPTDRMLPVDLEPELNGDAIFPGGR